MLQSKVMMQIQSIVIKLLKPLSNRTSETNFHFLFLCKATSFLLLPPSILESSHIRHVSYQQLQHLISQLHHCHGDFLADGFIVTITTFLTETWFMIITHWVILSFSFMLLSQWHVVITCLSCNHSKGKTFKRFRIGVVMMNSQGTL